MIYSVIHMKIDKDMIDPRAKKMIREYSVICPECGSVMKHKRDYNFNKSSVGHSSMTSVVIVYLCCPNCGFKKAQDREEFHF